METAKKKRALRSFCAVLSAVCFFISALSVFLYGLQNRYGGNVDDPAQREKLMEPLLAVCSEQLCNAFRVYYRSDGAEHADCPDALLPQNTNLRLIARDAKTGVLLLRTTLELPQDDNALLHKTEKRTVSYTADVNYLAEKKALVLIEYYLPATLSVRDGFYTAMIWARTGYALRPYLWSAGTVFLALTVLFCILFLRSAWREGAISHGRRLFREVPPDLLLLCFLPPILMFVSLLNSTDVTQLLQKALTAQNPEYFLYPAVYCAGLLFLLLWIFAAVLFSVHRYGIRGLSVYFRYENAAFTRRTLPAFLLLQIIKSCVFLLYASPHPRVVVAFLAVEKVLILPMLYRVLREIRTVAEDTEAVALGDLSHPIGTPRMYRTLQNHANDIRRIARRISMSADEYIRSGQFKAELITNLSHDIKTPLTSIINYAALLQNETLSEQDRQRYTAVLHRHAQRLSRLVEDLTQVSDTQSGKLDAVCERIDLASLVVQAAIGFKERLQKQQITLHFSVPGTPVYVCADNRLLWRVADNLLNNICKYTKPNTGVYISVTAKDGTAYAVFENIPAAPLDKSGDALMERFVRADSSRHTEGTGLGLSIARSLMELQGGTLNLRTQPSLFTAEITLPED